MKQITFSRDALKSLRKMPANTAKTIRTKIDAYAANPASQANNVTALKGSDYIRLRVGGYRVLMNDRGEVIEIIEIGPRGSIYKP